MAPVQAFKKLSEKLVFLKLQDKREKHEPKNQQENLVRTADFEKVFSEGDTKNWSYNLHTVTETINNTIPSIRNKDVTGGYNEIFLKSSNITLDENNQVMKKLK